MGPRYRKRLSKEEVFRRSKVHVIKCDLEYAEWLANNQSVGGFWKNGDTKISIGYAWHSSSSYTKYTW